MASLLEVEGYDSALWLYGEPLDEVTADTDGSCLCDNAADLAAQLREQFEEDGYSQ